MKEFTVTFEETIVQSFTIEAEDDEQAWEIAEQKYHDGEIVLENGECQQTLMAITEPSECATEFVVI